MAPAEESRTERRPAIDLIRGAALLIVVVGHLCLAVIDKPDGGVRGANLMTLFPEWAWLTIVAPMPVFFLAGGWANATSTFADTTRRLATLAGLGTVVLALWTVPVIVARLLNGSTGLVGDGARLATQPMWFFAAYAPLVAITPWIWRLSRPGLFALLTACIMVVLVCDVARFALSGPSWIGWFGFLPTYGSFWVLGMWWRRGSMDAGFEERRHAAPLTVAALLMSLSLTSKFHYSWALIDVVVGKRSNTTPPTFFTVTAGFMQAGLVMCAAGALDVVASKRAVLIARVRDVSVGVYLWHLTALMAVSALVAALVPMPVRFTAGWWLVRPVWFAAIAMVTSGLVRLTTKILATSVKAPANSGLTRADVPARFAGSLLMAGAAAQIGLKGPRDAVPAAILVIAMASAWWLLNRSQTVTA